jgi:hypothetical protein
VVAEFMDNVLVFCGVDTSICVETSIRDSFDLDANQSIRLLWFADKLMIELLTR